MKKFYLKKKSNIQHLKFWKFSLKLIFFKIEIPIFKLWFSLPAHRRQESNGDEYSAEIHSSRVSLRVSADTCMYTLHARLYRHSYRLQISKGFAWFIPVFSGAVLPSRGSPSDYLGFPLTDLWFKGEPRGCSQKIEQIYGDKVVESDYRAKGNFVPGRRN